MSADNALLARRWFQELWNENRTEIIDELAAPGSRGHLPGGETSDVDHLRVIHAEFHAAFPDLSIEVEDTIAQGDDVAVRWRSTAHHAGSGFGMRPSGKEMTFRGITWFRFRDGKLVEAWDCWNQAAVFQAMRDGTDCQLA